MGFPSRPQKVPKKKVQEHKQIDGFCLSPRSDQDSWVHLDTDDFPPHTKEHQINTSVSLFYFLLYILVLFFRGVAYSPTPREKLL